MVEKLGHKKRIQMMRGEWINEDKPGYQHSSAQPEEDIFGELSLPPREQRTEAEKEKPLAPIFQRREEGRETTPGAGLFVQGDEGEEDLYNATPRVSRTQEDPPAAAAAAAGELVSIFGPPLVRALTISPEAEAEELPDDFDELDALLAEQGMDAAASAATKKSAADAPNDVSMREQDFDDEMEAMAEMGMEW
jgi:replication fork protection complex subunit Csm3/Swi3